ncbi:transposase [Duganella sp. 3397]|uniref:IS66 family transposase n=1 Tax=Duganella sp. 3397 TaxID=2817732 RepID=UPI0028627A52|nr:IS66 family transposase [Duganella sp. 3397]MDR7047756.1 transposase [Duganella sp. 3397]
MPSATAKPSNLPPRYSLPELSLPAVLPTDAAALTTLLHSVIAAHNDVKAQALNHMQHMMEQFVLARHRMFGASSEQSSAQGRLFDEAETLATGSDAAQDAAPLPADTKDGDKANTKQARGKRGPLPAELARVDVVHDVPAAERTCPCGTPMVEIGEDVSEQLDLVPMQVRVLRHIRKRYGCPGSVHAPVTAALPPQPLPKSNASADLLVMLLVVKFIDGLPLARWVIGAADVLQPLHNLMRDALLEGAFLHIDETVVQVLKEAGKAPTSNSYMWVQTGGSPGRPVVVFDYDASRSGQVPVRLLHDYRGYVMTDGYSGYNELVRTGGIEQLICWAHVRRRFVEAVKVQPKGKRGLADEGVALIGRLYGIERDYKDADAAARLLARQQHSVPALAALRAWLDKTLPGVTPKSALGTALSYLRDHWPRLTRYTERGDLPIDNNRAENAIRPFVVGRKAWLFSDTVAGANASAVIYSVLETAKANGIEPYAWLRRVLRDLPAAKTVEDVEAMLPWNLSAASGIQNSAPTGVLQ